MQIDIDTLTEAELADLNNRVVARLRFLHEVHAHSLMLTFRIGDRVVFQPGDWPEVVGTLTRYNRKSVTVVADDGRRWNVSPHVVRRLDRDAATDLNVMPLRKA